MDQITAGAVVCCVLQKVPGRISLSRLQLFHCKLGLLFRQRIGANRLFLRAADESDENNDQYRVQPHWITLGCLDDKPRSGLTWTSSTQFASHSRSRYEVITWFASKDGP